MRSAGRLAEFWNLLRARMSLLRGRGDRARASLKAVLQRNPSSFPARFLMGRVYLLDGAVVKAKREFDLAWQIDPERFERAYGRLRGQVDGVPELFSSGEERGAEVSVSARSREARRLGDFEDDDERDRFASLPPITRDEIQGIDWERLEEEISRDS
ncbi:MAG: tetratricopeptide repeat protein [Planctomycetota bacterium]